MCLNLFCRKWLATIRPVSTKSGITRGRRDAGHRNFALVRRLKLALRDEDGRFPRMASEERMGDFDIEETNNKLGVLWTWDFNPDSYKPI